MPDAEAAVLLAPYDLREMAMLGDSGSDALGAVLGFESVAKLRGRWCWLAIGALAGLTVAGELGSLGAAIEAAADRSRVDAWGRSGG